MSKLKVYISSTYLDLKDHRQRLIQLIQDELSDFFELCEVMEKMKGDLQNRTNEEICLDEVRDADLYILLVGKRYGSSPKCIRKKDLITENKEGYSYTELEYKEACKSFDEKFYGIYTIELSDNFFAVSGLDPNSDLQAQGKQDKYDRFLESTGARITIHEEKEFNRCIPKILSKFYNQYIEKVDLKISPLDKASINRQPLYKEFQNKKINIQAGSCVWLMEAENDMDCYDQFTSRLVSELSPKHAADIYISYIRSNAVSLYLNTPDKTKALDALLQVASGSMAEDVMFGITFNNISECLKDIKKNVYIGFLVDSETDLQFENSNFIALIAEFIKKLEALRQVHIPRITFFYLIYVLKDKTNNLAESLKKYFEGIQYFPLGKLTDVKESDAREWIEERKNSFTSINNDPKEIFKKIFLDPDKFPAKYKKCIELIDRRTK